jgi:hypothetical protein
MNALHLPTRAVFACVTLAALAGCGGGGGSVSNPSSTAQAEPSAPATGTSTVTLSGTVATGAAFAGAIVTVIDSAGTTVGTSLPVGADGSYKLTLSAGAKAPLVLLASRSNVSGGVDTLVSVSDSATTATLNITPLSNLIASRLSASGDPLKLADEVRLGSAKIDAASLTTKITEVKTLLAPLLAATGNSGVDPLHAAFSADGTGLDRLLDSVTVNITPSGSKTANIEIGLKLSSLDPLAQPLVIRFDSTQGLAAIVANAANQAVLQASISAASLVPAGTNLLISQFINRWNTCQALPLATRVNGNGGVAANLAAPECTGLFVGNNPAGYLHDGLNVGRGQAFDSLFTEAGTGLIASQGSFETTLANGDVVISYRSVTPLAAETFDSLVLRLDGNQLRLIGNQYAYQGTVNPHHQVRRHVAPGEQALDHLSTGYVLSVRDRLLSGQSIFDRVEVLGPDGSTWVLRPTVGSPVLSLVSGQATTRSNFLRLSAAWLDTTTAGTPANQETELVFSNPPKRETQLAAYPAQSVWRFSYFLASQPTSAAAVQVVRTRARALTLAELRAKTLATLSAGTVTALQNAANSEGRIDLSGSFISGVQWQVPTNALPVSRLDLEGKLMQPGTSSVVQSFVDWAAVPTTALAADVPCTVQSATDQHCANGSSRFANGAQMTALQLWARDSAGREFTQTWATERLLGR